MKSFVKILLFIILTIIAVTCYDQPITSATVTQDLNHPILAPVATDKSIYVMDVLTFILALVGALAWLVPVFNLFTKQKTYGKIISRYGCTEPPHGIVTTYMCILLSIFRP